MKKPILTHDASKIELSSCLACEHYNHQGLFESAACKLTRKATTPECIGWEIDKEKEAHYNDKWTLTFQ